MNDKNTEKFTGCKMALISGRQLVVYLRDNLATIPYPNCWDFPGGGREGNETAEECVLRELNEEFSLVLTKACLVYKQIDINQTGNGNAYFFVAHIDNEQLDKIRFGNEGQYWRLMDIEDYLNHPQAINSLQQRLKRYLAEIDY
ncbi:RNA pyrophosphohydrolase [Shewanella sp. P1-14-1]|uniref:NUDIX hydrolase n=1 Tax=Shewanella sp. P1-14-1 TaxID=1723761 RepID=UPI0006D6530F|nr:NUDIX hydrolase [Shewanella sp. P1-14-1]KPZ71555.1 RNA pyrophosphohydrolase [Shewanella sp. P1-14-1]